MHLVSPVIACFVAVYGPELSLGAWAEIDPLLMMRPPRGCYAFIMRFLCTQESAGKVHLHHFAPLCESERFDGNRRRRDARIVKQDVEAGELLARSRKQVLDRIGPPDITTDEDCQFRGH